MSSSTVVRAASPSEASPVVLGGDGTRKPRTPWLQTGSADFVTRAVVMIKARVLKIETEEQKALALPLAR